MGALYSFLESNGHGPVLPDAAVRRLYVRVGRSSAHRSQALGHPSWLRRLGGLYGPRGTNDCPVPSPKRQKWGRFLPHLQRANVWIRGREAPLPFHGGTLG